MFSISHGTLFKWCKIVPAEWPFSNEKSVFYFKHTVVPYMLKRKQLIIKFQNSGMPCASWPQPKVYVFSPYYELRVGFYITFLFRMFRYKWKMMPVTGSLTTYVRYVDLCNSSLVWLSVSLTTLGIMSDWFHWKHTSDLRVLSSIYSAPNHTIPPKCIATPSVFYLIPSNVLSLILSLHNDATS